MASIFPYFFHETLLTLVEFLKNILGLIGPVIFGKMYEKTVGAFPAAFLHFFHGYESFGVCCESTCLPWIEEKEKKN